MPACAHVTMTSRSMTSQRNRVGAKFSYLCIFSLAALDRLDTNGSVPCAWFRNAITGCDVDKLAPKNPPSTQLGSELD